MMVFFLTVRLSSTGRGKDRAFQKLLGVKFTLSFFKVMSLCTKTTTKTKKKQKTKQLKRGTTNGGRKKSYLSVQPLSSLH